MMEFSCHCGAVRPICDDAPAEVTIGTFPVCRRYGVLRAYCSPSRA